MPGRGARVQGAHSRLVTRPLGLAASGAPARLRRGGAGECHAVVGALLPAVIAVVGTLGGVFLTQRRERQRERDRWSREDELRNFETRHDASVSAYTSIREMARKVDTFG